VVELHALKVIKVGGVGDSLATYVSTLPEHMLAHSKPSIPLIGEALSFAISGDWNDVENSTRHRSLF
jgi:hypothetical protein